MSDITELLVGLGATEDEIEAATRNGTLLALAAERFLLPGERKLTRAEVAAQSGIDDASLDKLWLALGFARPSSGEAVFTERDIETLRVLVSDGTTMSDYTLHEARVISSAVARVAEVLVDETWDTELAAGRSDEEALSDLAGTYDVDRFERLLLRLLRQHIVAAVYRRLASGGRSTGAGTSSLAVGFADVVGFTSLSGSLSAADLTRLVVRFEQTTFDLIAEMGGRVVKTIGDEVMFTFDDAATAADFALRVAGAGGNELPPIRVGLGWGPVVARQGDCFGPTVNLASRLAGVAAAGEVVVAPAMAEQLAGHERFETTTLGERDLKGFGPVQLWRLQRRGAGYVTSVS